MSAVLERATFETATAKLKESPSLSWDEAVWRIADDDIDAREDEE